MWIFLLGYIFSVLFESRLIKFFEHNNFFRKTVTFSGSAVAWLYQEHLRSLYDISNKTRIFSHDTTGAKKFITELRFRCEIINQILNLHKYFWLKIHLPHILEVGTVLVLFCFVIIVLFKLYFSELKAMIRIFIKNYYKLVKFILYSIKFSFCNFYNLRVNDKLFFGLLVFTLKHRCFSIYFNLDFFVMFKPFVLLLIVLVSVMFVLLFNYVVYLYILSNFPKNIAIILQLISIKSIFYVLLVLFLGVFVMLNLGTQMYIVENIFKENLLKLVVFYLYVKNNANNKSVMS